MNEAGASDASQVAQHQLQQTKLQGVATWKNHEL